MAESNSCVDACRRMPTCTVCGLPKKPRGRSAPLEMAASLCGHDCPGYDSDPRAGHLWPGEPTDPPITTGKGAEETERPCPPRN